MKRMKKLKEGLKQHQRIRGKLKGDNNNEKRIHN